MQTLVESPGQVDAGEPQKNAERSCSQSGTLTTEHTEYTELPVTFSSVYSVCSVVGNRLVLSNSSQDDPCSIARGHLSRALRTCPALFGGALRDIQSAQPICVCLRSMMKPVAAGLASLMFEE